LVCALILLGARPAAARTWYIQADGGGDAPTIQAGHDSAAMGDSLLVSPGQYDENLIFGKSLTLVSSDGPEATVIDGMGVGRVLTIMPGPGSGLLVAGFTLRNGRAPSENGLFFGGGVLVRFAGTTLRNNIVTGNVANTLGASVGGGVCVQASDCIVEECLITANFSAGDGGGLAVTTGTIVRHNDIRANQCHVGGGGISGVAALIYENLIVGNSADYFGGGVVMQGSARIRNNTIVANQVGIADAPAGVYILGSSIVSQNIIAENTTGYPGGAAAGIMSASDWGASIFCNDVWGNDSDEIDYMLATVQLNFNSDPLFCDRTNFGISTNSPCANAGPCGLVGAHPPSCSATRVESVSWGGLKLLYRDSPRR